MTISIVGVSGSLSTPSRTSALVTAVTERFAAALEQVATVESTTLELGDLLPDLTQGRYRPELGEGARAALDLVESADLLVVGSPAYRAAYTGLFKHFFDYVDQYALVDKPVILTATGGSDRHALLVEHQMRPLFGFFQALTLPLGVYGKESDFEDYRVVSTELLRRLDVSIERALPLVRYRLTTDEELRQVSPAGWL